MYELRSYQERAVEEALGSPFRYEAFDMGLGKTLIMLDFLKRSGLKALVMAPLLVATRTWPQEIRKWTDFSYTVLHGTDKGDLYRQKSDIKIINYDGVKWFFDQIVKYGSVDLKDRVLILDESTALKSHKSVRFKKTHPLRHFFRHNGIFCLSGEPMPNGYLDLWSQYFMIDGGDALYRTYEDYESEFFIRDRYNKYDIKLRHGAAETIQKRVAPITSILRASDHMTMPESVFIEMQVELPPAARHMYNKFREDYLTEFGSNLEYTLVADTAGVHSGKLRQLTQGAVYHDEGDRMIRDRAYTVIHRAKLQALLQVLEEANGSPILCPIYFSFEYTEIASVLGYAPPLIAGGTTEREKQSILDKWDRGDIPLLTVQPASVSHGLNMQTGGHIIVWYGRPWSLEQYNQLNGRLIRPGQKHPVRVIFISAIDTADDRVAKVLATKGATQESFKQAILDDLRNR